MLRVLFTQIQESERPGFVEAILMRVPKGNTHFDMGKEARFPSYNRKMSELPLLAEFVIRMGHCQRLVEAINAVQEPTIGLVTLFLQLEDLIALNFTLFSDAELATLANDFTPFWKICGNLELEARKQSFGGQHASEKVRNIGLIALEIRKSLSGIAEECRTARHYYLRTELLKQSPNLEIDSDKRKVESFLIKLGFSTEMVGALNAAESEYTATATPFELKNCLSHLRSFLEHLHRQAAKSIAANAGDTIKDRWGDATEYLLKHGYFAKQNTDFATALYTLISDTSVHPLVTEREYARLLRNVVIEYGVMFLTMLDKRGIKL